VKFPLEKFYNKDIDDFSKNKINLIFLKPNLNDFLIKDIVKIRSGKTPSTKNKDF